MTHSQAIRTEAGWEHEADTQGATRGALAEAVMADLSRHAADDVVALAFAHADCEDLADRIRTRLRNQGQLCDPTLTGPARHSYLRGSGDRVLPRASPAC